MKRLIITLIVLAPLLGMGQNESPVDRLFNKYAHKDGITTVNISGKMLSLANEVRDSSNHKADILAKLSGIRILSVENKELNKDLNFYKELDANGFFKKNGYEALMEVTEKNETVRFYGKEGDKGRFVELLLVVGGNDNTLISIRGIIDPKDIGKITGSLNMRLPNIPK